MGKKSKIIVVFLFFFITAFSFGQLSVKKSSIDSGGGVALSSGIKTVFTLGEIAVNESAYGNLHISEGFISPQLFTSVGIQDYGVLEGITLSPNPTANDLFFSFPSISDYDVEIFTMQGKRVYKSLTSNVLTARICVSKLTNGVYIVVIKDSKRKRYKTFKLLKN